MLEIKGQTIYLTRGDTALIQLTLKDRNGDDYVPTEGDSIRFAMKRKMSDDSEILATVSIPTDTLLLEIEPSVTDGLEFNKNKPYKYDIELTYSTGRVDTFVSDADIYIMPEADTHES